MDETDLNDDLLQAKRKKPYPVARARIVMGEPSPASQALEDQDGSSIGENKLDEQRNEGSQEHQVNEGREDGQAPRGEA